MKRRMNSVTVFASVLSARATRSGREMMTFPPPYSRESPHAYNRSASIVVAPESDEAVESRRIARGLPRANVELCRTPGISRRWINWSAVNVLVLVRNRTVPCASIRVSYSKYRMTSAVSVTPVSR